MQLSTTPLYPGEGHEFKSLCLTCQHYEFSVVIERNKKKRDLADHVCHTDCPECVPGDCVIRCDHWEKSERYLTPH